MVHPIPARSLNLLLVHKKRTCEPFDFILPDSESERKQKTREIPGPYQRGGKKWLNGKVIVIPIIVGALETVPKKTRKDTGDN